MDNSFIYWANLNQKETGRMKSPDDLIVHISIISHYGGGITDNWYSCRNTDILIGFLKYVAVPSFLISRQVSNDIRDGKEVENKSGVVYALCRPYDFVEVIESMTDDNLMLDAYDYFYERLDSVDRNDIDAIKKIADELSENDKKSFESTMFSVEVFENAEDLLSSYYRDFSREGMLDQLEEDLGLSEEEILNAIDNISGNKFLSQRIFDLFKEKIFI